MQASCLLHVGLAWGKNAKYVPIDVRKICSYCVLSELNCIIYSACSGVHSLAKARPVDDDTCYCLVLCDAAVVLVSG